MTALALPRQLQTRRHVTGIALIICVSLIWIAASFLVQSLVSGDQQHRGLHPFVLTYICNSLFLVYLPIEVLKEYRNRRKFHERTSTPGSEELPIQSTEPAEALEPSESSGTLEIVQLLQTKALFSPAESMRVWKAALAVAPLWFIAQLSFNYSLSITSVTSNTILSSPSSLFTFSLSVLFLNERFTYAKLVAVILTIIGTTLVAVSDSQQDDSGSSQSEGTTGPWGDALTLFSAAAYAGYTVTLKAMLPEDSEDRMFLFFGFLGLINFLFFGPFVLLFNAIGSLSLSTITSTTLCLAILKGLFDNALSDYLWARAVLLVGPTIATMGLSLQVPIAMVVDPLVHEHGWWSAVVPALLEASGAGCILTGFFTINLDTS